MGKGGKQQQVHLQQQHQQRVALIVGVTGIVGNSLAEALQKQQQQQESWKIYGVGVRQRPDYLPPAVHYIQCNLLNRPDTISQLSPLRTSVTHIFWATWVARDTEEENCEANGSMLSNVLDAITEDGPPSGAASSASSALEHVCLTTGGKHYVGPFDQGRRPPYTIPDPPFCEEMPRLPVPNFYYTLEDLLLDRAQRAGFTWSVHRPNHVFGFAPRSLMNCVSALAVYALLCKKSRMPFVFPGSTYAWNNLGDASDAGLIAEQEIWAATSTDPRVKNQAFNVVNGDVYSWKRLWSILADEFDIQVAPYTGESFSLAEHLKDKDPVWDAIVEEHSLSKTKLEEIGQFWFIDTILNKGPVEFVSSMNKSKELGFTGFRNTEKSLVYWIDQMRKRRFLP